MEIKLNHIYNIDCFEGLKDIPSKSVDLVVTDPPYWHKKGRGINRETGKAYANGHSPFANSELFSTTGFMMGEMSTFGEEEIDQLLSELTRVCKIPNIYLFCNETQVPYYAMWAERNKLMFTIMVWEKPLSIINKNRFSQNLEFIVRICDYGTALNRLDENEIYNRVRRVRPVAGCNKIHPTEKPVQLVSEFIRLSSDKGDVVLDAFMGSGTTAISCIREKRNYIGFELSKEYHGKALKRIDAEQQQLKLF